MGKIEELEEALRLLVEHMQSEFEISIPFRELKIQLIRQSNISGHAEPVLIYFNIDCTSNKVKSYTLGKNPERN
jgi:hypothetical protein